MAQVINSASTFTKVNKICLICPPNIPPPTAVRDPQTNKHFYSASVHLFRSFTTTSHHHSNSSFEVRPTQLNDSSLMIDLPPKTQNQE